VIGCDHRSQNDPNIGWGIVKLYSFAHYSVPVSHGRRKSTA